MNPGVVVALIVLASIVIIAVTVGVIIYFVGKARKKRAEEEAKNKKTYVYTPKPKKPQITEEERKEKKANAHNRKLLELSNLGKIESSKYKVESNGGDIEAVGIIYNKNSKSYLFNPNGLKLNVGDVVKVKDQNDNIRTVVVVIANQLFKDEDIVKPFKEILEVVYKADSSKVVVEEKKLEPVEEPKEEAKPEEINPEEEVQEEPVVEESEAIKPQEEEKVEEAQAEPRPEVKEEPQPEETQPVEEVKEEAKPEEEASPVEKEKPAEPVQEEPQEEDKPEESEADEEAEDDDSDDDSDEEESPKEETQSQSNASSEVEYDEATKQYKITKIKKTYLPVHVVIEKNSMALCECVLTISKNQIIHYIKTFDEVTMKKVDGALSISLGFKGGNNN